MSYDKQTWNKYDELKTEEENIENGAVVTDNRMNHMETGIGDNDANLASHLADKNNPHKVTAAQVGLGNVQNFGLATEDEAKQGISNAKYMTPSLTQAVLSANINSIAYANSSDGTDGFTTVYPNLNLLTNSRLQSGNITPFAPVNNAVLTINSNVKGLNVSCSGGAISYQQGVGQGVIPVSAGNQYTISVKVINTGTVAIDKFILQFGFYNSAGTGLGYPNKTFSIPADGKVYSLSYTATTTADTTGMRYYCLDTATVANVAHTFTIYDMKAELGSTATPYMPSASEVTTSDWPKYVGFSNTVKTNKSASDYTWFPVKDSELTNKVDSHINNKSNPHAVTASQVGAYTKTEADAKFATSQSLTDLSNKVIANKGNLASGTDLDNVIDIGTYRIGGLTGGTDIINVPSECSGTTIYAYLTVSGTTTSVVQELIVYDSKTVSQIYSRSRSGSTSTFSPWSKTVMADDSGKVTMKDLVASSITLPNDTDGWVTLQNLHYKKKNGLVSFWFDFTTTAAGTAVVGTFPDGFIPPNDVMFVIVNWTTTTASSKVLQLTGLNSSTNTGLVGILNAVANTRYTGHFTFSI
ncbi:pyocin knob domain-containing protein [Lactococcus lactis]|uniref:pyocin knob domain-containing protein n=2 Tax=Lactococcus lactis TaxID=1358 RepID=UPI0022E3EFFE|nr:pyocin knob domain-containing protein [Lactococcus lactis]